MASGQTFLPYVFVCYVVKDGLVYCCSGINSSITRETSLFWVHLCREWISKVFERWVWPPLLLIL